MKLYRSDCPEGRECENDNLFEMEIQGWTDIPPEPKEPVTLVEQVARGEADVALLDDDDVLLAATLAGINYVDAEASAEEQKRCELDAEFAANWKPPMLMTVDQLRSELEILAIN